MLKTNRSKKLKRVLACVCALMLAFCLIPKNEIKTASASDIRTPYFTSNLIPYPYVSAGPTGSNTGISYSTNDDYSVTFNGTSTKLADYVFFQGSIDYSTLVSKLSLSLDVLRGSWSGNSEPYLQVYLNGQYTGSATPSKGWKNENISVNGRSMTRVIIYFPSGTTLSDFTVRPMLNPGAVAYPFSPYYLLGYDEGFSSGYSQSYNEYIGGFFKNSTVNITLRDKITNSPTYIDNQTLDFNFREGYWRVNFSSIYTYLSSNYAISNYNIELRIILGYSRFYSLIGYKSTLGTFSADFRYYVDRVSKVEGVTSITGSLVTLGPNYEFVNQDGYIPLTSQEVFDFNSFYIYINSLEIKSSNITDFSNLSLCDFSNPVVYGSTEGDYNSGFRDGYVKGEDDGFFEGYDAGKDVGYKEGKDVGYKEGYENGKDVGYNDGKADGYDKGMQDSGGFYSMIFAVFDAPIQVLTDMFNFEIFGVNMTAFVISIISIAVISFIVRMFI